MLDVESVKRAAMQAVWLTQYSQRQLDKPPPRCDGRVRAVSYASADARYPGRYIRMEKK